MSNFDYPWAKPAFLTCPEIAAHLGLTSNQPRKYLRSSLQPATANPAWILLELPAALVLAARMRRLSVGVLRSVPNLRSRAALTQTNFHRLHQNRSPTPTPYFPPCPPFHP